MNTMTTEPVLFDDCEYSDSQELLHDGEPYTGVVVEYAPDGTLITEEHYRSGIRDGGSRGWYHSGVLREEADYAFGLRRFLREWHRNGQPRRELHYDDRGRTVSDQAWDANGQPVDPASLA